MKAMLYATSALLAVSAHAATYGPYPEETYVACGNPSAKTAVIIQHGGWNLAGSKTAPNPMLICHYMASRGIYAVSIDYRFAASASTAWPAQWQDAQTAIRWLRQTHKTVGIIGLSAGGYDALGASLRPGTIHWTPTDPKGEAMLYRGVSSQPDFVVAISPLSDLTNAGMWPKAISDNIGNLTDSGLSITTAQAMASPISLVRSDAPSALIFHGSNDALVPVDQSRALVSEMIYVGEPVKYIETTGGHVMEGLTWPQKWDMLREIAAFAANR